MRMQRTYRLELGGKINIPEATRSRIALLGKRRRFKDGEFVMRQGDAANGFYLLLQGQVIVGRYAANGTLTIFGVAGSGDLFGELAFFAGTPRLADTIADGAVEVVHFDNANYGKIVATEPKLTAMIIKSLASQCRVILERLDAERTMSLADRLAQALLSMETSAGETISCTHQQLGDLIGVSRVSLGVALRQLERSGAIAGSYGKVRIIDRQQLEGRLKVIGRLAA